MGDGGKVKGGMGVTIWVWRWVGVLGYVTGDREKKKGRIE